MTPLFRSASLAVCIAMLAACGEKPKPIAASQPAPTAPIAPPPAKPSLDSPAIVAGKVPTIRGSCSVDAVAGRPHQQDQQVAASERIRFEGWAGDVATGTVPVTAVLELVGSATYFVPIANRAERPDVASAIKSGLLLSGWSVEVDTSSLPPGRFGMNIIQSDGSSTSRCDTGRSIVLSK